ncbi:MAG: DUF6029 family protein [bacterium]
MKIFYMILIFIVLFIPVNLFAEKQETKENGETRTKKESVIEQKEVSVEDEKTDRKKKSPVKWSFFSRNKGTVHKDFQRNEYAYKDSYASLETETGAELKWKKTRFGLQKTGLVFIKKDNDNLSGHSYRYSDEIFNHGWEHWINRVYVHTRQGNFSIRAGDFHKTMNRGMLLSMKNDPVYGDNTLRGLDFIYRKKSLSAQIFGGKANPEIRAPDTNERMKMTDDFIWGSEIGYWIYKRKIKLSLSYLGAAYLPFNPDYDYDNKRIESFFHIAGTNLSLVNIIPSSRINFSAAAAPYAMRKYTDRNEPPDMPPEIKNSFSHDFSGAHALHISALKWFDISGNRLSLTLEAKRYEKYYMNHLLLENPDFKRRYFNLPSLVPETTALANEFDTQAVRASISFNDTSFTEALYSVEFTMGQPLENTLPFDKLGNISYFDEKFYFIGVGVDKKFSSLKTSADFGIHKANRKKDDYYKRWIYAGIEAGTHFSEISLKFSNKFYIKDLHDLGIKKNDGAIENAFSANFSWKNSLTASFYLTYWDNHRYWELDSNADTSRFFPGGKIGFSYKCLKTSVYYGKQKGGYVCDGVCRYVPDFEGGKIELEISL